MDVHTMKNVQWAVLNCVNDMQIMWTAVACMIQLLMYCVKVFQEITEQKQEVNIAQSTQEM